MVDYIYLTYPRPFHGLPWYRTGTVAEVKNFILSQPYIKGEFVDIRTGASWKFRCVKPFHSDDIFWKKFDYSKVDSQTPPAKPVA